MAEQTPDITDVAVVGYGPVGQLTAALLGRAGHRVTVFEQWPATYHLPRAAHVDHEIMRMFQAIGIARDLEPRFVPSPGASYLNSEGELLLKVPSAETSRSGWRPHYLIYQPEVEQALDRAARGAPTVRVHRGWTATGVTQHDDHVELHVRAPGSTATTTVRARYLIGADGANSLIRRCGDFGMTDLGFEEDWLVVDLRPHDPEALEHIPEAAQVCSPERPTSIFRWLGRHTCRFEFMLREGETPAEMEEAPRVWRLLERWGVTEATARLVRQVVYRFRSLLVDRFRDGRVLLAGDAAHVMPPFMGQGMCSGLRDATNLAWKLDMVLRGHAGAELLNSYERERRPHVNALIQLSIETGRIVCVTDPDAAAARDATLLSGNPVQLTPFPHLVEGVLAPGPAAGRLSVQSRVAADGRSGLFDDVCGGGWTILCRRGEVEEGLPREHLEFLARIGANIVHITPADVPGAVVDLDLDYHQWFAELGADAIVVRPDFYVYGACRSPDLPDLITTLMAALTARTPDGTPVLGTR